MIPGITITCFAASYGVSLALEFSRLFFRAPVRLPVIYAFTGAGLFAHTSYLITRAEMGMTEHSGIPPLSSYYDFCLLAAWLLATAYLIMSIRYPRNAVGIFLLPLILGLIGVAVAMHQVKPFQEKTALDIWRVLHGTALTAGTATITLGFATGMMYLVQSYRLKQKLPPRPGFKLPSLELLQRLNQESLIVSACLLGLGLISGVALNLSHQTAEGFAVQWTDPVVLSSAVLFGLLVFATVVESLYKPAREGRKVAYLTLACFVCLGLALYFVWFGEHAVPMKLRVFGCSHHSSHIETRERLAFTPEQARDALSRLRQRSPEAEIVLLSTCNRVELYFANEQEDTEPSKEAVADFLADFHGLDATHVTDVLFDERGEDAVRHLFQVAASLDSMVVGEAQILSQVKQAYERATECDSTGPLTHSVFQAAIRVAKRVARETAINQKRVSIPSVAVADFAKQLFERFDDKSVLVLGAGDMAEETLRYLIDEGAQDITIVNRSRDRAEKLARLVAGRVLDWGQLHELCVEADLIVSTTGSREPIVTLEEFKSIHQSRGRRPLFVLDLAVPRDFDPAVGDLTNIYLYSIEDLKAACEANRRAREKEWPKAERIIEDETAQFLAELNHRTTAPTIRRLRDQANEVKSDELTRLMNKLGDMEERDRQVIEPAFDRLVNKLLHPPLESLRDEAARGTHHGLLDALKQLFQIRE